MTTFQVFSNNQIASSSFSSSLVKAIVTGPKGENIKVKLTHNINKTSSDDLICVEYIPINAGQHRIDVTYLNESISGSPYYVDVYDPTDIEFTHLPSQLLIGEENTIESKKI